MEMKNFSAKTIQLEPIKGAHLSDCKAEAVSICAAEECDVEFVFNDVTYTVRYSAILSEVRPDKI